LSFLSSADQSVVDSCACDVHEFVRRGSEDAIRIGKKLRQAKALLGHGRFLAWLQAEFTWSADTAGRFMKVAERFGDIPHCAEFALTAYYILAGNSVSEEAREEALGRAAKGEKITRAVACQIMNKHAPKPVVVLGSAELDPDEDDDLEGDEEVLSAELVVGSTLASPATTTTGSNNQSTGLEAANMSYKSGPTVPHPGTPQTGASTAQTTSSAPSESEAKPTFESLKRLLTDLAIVIPPPPPRHLGFGVPGVVLWSCACATVGVGGPDGDGTRVPGRAAYGSDSPNAAPVTAALDGRVACSKATGRRARSRFVNTAGRPNGIDQEENIMHTFVSSTPIQISRIGQCSRVNLPAATTSDQQVLALFDRVFQMRSVLAETIPTGVRLQRGTRPLFTGRESRESRQLLFPASCESLVLQLLDVLGVAFLLKGTRSDALELPNAAERLVDLPMLNMIANNEHVVVKHDSRAVDVAWLIVQVCRAFPRLRIVILVKQVPEARRVADRLRDLGVDVSLSTSATKTKPARVAVTTFASAGHETVGIWDRDLVVVHDVAEAMSEVGRLAIEAAHRDHPSAPRIVGFAKSAFTPSINQAAEMLTVYGPVEVLVPAHGAVVRQVEYMCLPVAGMNYTKVNAAQSSSTGEAKRVFVWSNPVRNRLVAKIARGFAEGHVENVVGRFPEIAGHPLLGKPVGVLVVVENGVHAANLLHRHLGGWSTIDPDIGIVPPSAPRWGWPAGKPGPAVCTFDGLKALYVATYDVIVRADAGTGAVPLSKNALVSGNSTLKPMLLLDFDDWRDPVLASHADKRRAAYAAAGWLPVGGDRQPRELRRFLAQHPQGTKLRRQIEQMARRVAAQNRGG